MTKRETADGTARPKQELSSLDRRLLPAISLIERGRIEVLTLDVFDTVLWRTVRDPIDAFQVLGTVLRDDDLLASEVSPELFGHLRCRAERLARLRSAPDSGAQEVSLEAIYDALPGHVLRNITPHEVMEREVALEAELTIPDLDICAFAATAKASRGVQVALVSDTYFSEKQLRRLLDKPVIDDIGIDHIFTSSTYAVGKGFGLFAKVLKELDVPPSHVLHVGDHPQSDVTAPSAAGIHSVHYERFDEATLEILDRESKQGETVGTTLAGDAGITALRSKTLGRRSQDDVGAAVRPYWRFGAHVLGPVFTGFAEWVHRLAAEEGVDTAYCLMREGEFLARLLDGAKMYVHAPARAETLWASRHVTARAAIIEADRSELTSFLHRRRRPTLRGFLEGIGLTLADVPELAGRGDSSLDDPTLLEQTLAIIEHRPELRMAIITSSAQLRERLVSSIMARVGDEKRMLVVDLGWGATIQHNLQRVLAESGTGVEVIGAYLMTNEAAVDRILGGLRAYGFLGTGGVPERESVLISRSPEIVEQVFMHDVGTLVGFTPDLEPVCEAARQSPVQVLQRTAVQSGMLAFQDEWARYAPHRPASTLREPAVRQQLLRCIMRFVTSPTSEEAAMFAGWLHDDNFGSDASESVVSGALTRLVKYMTPDQYLALPSTRVFWPFGLAALYDERLAAATSAVIDGAVPLEAFNRSEQHFLPIYVDDGSGYVERIRTPVRVNAAGLCFGWQSLTERAVHRLRFAFPGGAGIVRIDSVGFSFSIRGRASTIDVLLDEPSDFEHLRFEHAQQLAPNLVVGRTQAPQLVYEAPTAWRDEIYNVVIEVAFAWLPIAPLPARQALNGNRAPAPMLRRAAGRALRKTKPLLFSSDPA